MQGKLRNAGVRVLAVKRPRNYVKKKKKEKNRNETRHKKTEKKKRTAERKKNKRKNDERLRPLLRELITRPLTSQEMPGETNVAQLQRRA